MPISKIKGTGIVDNVELQGTEAARMPIGTTAQREGSPKKGDIRFNDTTDLMEYFDGTTFKTIDSPPVVNSISPTTALVANTSITITGTNFQSGATVTFVGSDGTEFASPSVAVNSSTQITAQTPNAVLTVAKEPYDIRVANVTGLSGTLTQALDAGSTPTFSTAAGNIGTVYEDITIGTSPSTSLALAATDADGQAVSITSSDFSINGLTLATSGSITGTPNVSDTYASGGVTHTFNGVASDGTNTTTRTFNILRKWLDGSTSALATTTTYLAANDITVAQAYLKAPTGYSSLGVQQFYVYHDSTNNDYYIKLPGSWIRSNAAISQLSSSSSSSTNWNYGTNGFAIQRRYGLDADLRWSFTKYFVYMHGTDSDGSNNPDDTREFTNAAFTGWTAGGQTIPAPTGSGNQAYVSRTVADANGNNLTLTPVAQMLNGYSPSNSGNQSLAWGTPGLIHGFKKGGEFAPNFQASGTSAREIMFNMMPGSSYTNGEVTISNTAGTAPTNYRNFPMSAGSSAQTVFRIVYYDDGSEILEIPDVEIWVNGT